MQVSINIKDALTKAIEAEWEGYNFYSMASHSCVDKKGKEVFETLAQEELHHVNFLRHQHKSIIEIGKTDPDFKLVAKVMLDIENPIFSDEIKSRIDDAHFEMTALAVGIQLELSAMEFYKKAAIETTDEYAKSFFTNLAEWETSHYESLLRQQTILKDEYWSNNNFAPF